jgi:hypothetical protein
MIVTYQSDHLHSTLIELILQAGEGTQLSGTHLLAVSWNISRLIEIYRTGVKSAGCEKRIVQLSPINSWKSISPWVVRALKLGAMEPRRRLKDG